MAQASERTDENTERVPRRRAHHLPGAQSGTKKLGGSCDLNANRPDADKHVDRSAPEEYLVGENLEALKDEARKLWVDPIQTAIKEAGPVVTEVVLINAGLLVAIVLVLGAFGVVAAGIPADQVATVIQALGIGAGAALGGAAVAIRQWLKKRK